MENKKIYTNNLTDSDSAVDNYFKGIKKEVETAQTNRSQSMSAEMELIMKRKRSVILSIATKTGIKEVNSWTKFNNWMLKSSIYKKELHAYNIDELDELQRQFRQLETNYENSAKKVGNKAWHHATGIPQTSSN